MEWHMLLSAMWGGGGIHTSRIKYLLGEKRFINNVIVILEGSCWVKAA